ncbi:hypothetical protein PoB_004055400 [Plakobranchus ocellatus]|uniref:Uncharacterized protein n=1 Tax=Plakobranchus ocellatus TaxID=259542 RepID=A0AAV4B5S9_9GAST|nr:hypothetical protein PoB_004055400 [Plakobranchus ocellatus]
MSMNGQWPYLKFKKQSQNSRYCTFSSAHVKKTGARAVVMAPDEMREKWHASTGEWKVCSSVTNCVALRESENSRNLNLPVLRLEIDRVMRDTRCESVAVRRDWLTRVNWLEIVIS